MLTADHTYALRSAHDVTFHLNDGESVIRCWGIDHSLTMEVPVDRTTFESYDGAGGAPVGYSYKPGAAYDRLWHTIARDCRAGTQIALHWTASNQSPVLDEAGLVQDHLDMGVGTSGKRARWYRIDTRVGLDNSARMIRR